ncbi:hypothetical protein [Bifidobacterium animalis]|uniref:hypothetical protein n=1 Tax=Bifidobacterium animalis TaxID=28025 RepID=UPI001020C6E4|nr:hypothetical protein [Bifidobacterium animalis]RYN04958.1 hypothetical protein PG1528B_1558 [Bifidobacterium animalis subsp. lactis]
MTSKTNGRTMEQWVKISAVYLQEAVQQLRREGRLYAMHVDTTITDSDSNRTIARINVKPQGKTGSLVASSAMEHLSQGELLLTIGTALAMYTEAASSLYDSTPQDNGDDTGREE